MTFILAIDYGTSGIKSSLVSVQGVVVATLSEDLPTTYRPDGTAEQSPDAWWQALLRTGRALVVHGHVPPKDIRAVAVSSTFSSTVAVDKYGEPLLPCLTWMDSRGAPFVRQVMRGFPTFQGYGLFKMLTWIRKTGGAPSLSGKDDIGHAVYVKHAHPDLYARVYKFLPSKDYLNYKLTGKMCASHDSATLFWASNIRDPRRIRYDTKLLALLGIEAEKLPAMVPATTILGPLLPDVAHALGLGSDVEVVCGSPDHQAAAIGSGAVRDFEGHLYIGTSSWIQCLLPFKKTDPLHSIASLPSSIPGRYYCANEQDLAGGCLAFLLDRVVFDPNGLIQARVPADSYERLDRVAAEVEPGSGSVLFLPWLNGERTPVDDPMLRGAFFNLATTTTQAHLVRAVMEGVAFNTRWCFHYVEKFIGRPLFYLHFIGGGALSDTWCQIFADVLQREIRRVEHPRQANARGATWIAAVARGQIRFEDIPNLIRIEKRFAPNPDRRALYDRLYSQFLALYRANRTIFRQLNRA